MAYTLHTSGFGYWVLKCIFNHTTFACHTYSHNNLHYLLGVSRGHAISTKAHGLVTAKATKTIIKDIHYKLLVTPHL